jgi:hypothetical protein
MRLQVTPIQQVDSRLIANEVYWLTTSYEQQKDYIYAGSIDGLHCFFRAGAIKNHMRRVLVGSKDLNIEDRDVRIVNDRYKVDVVSKDENPEEYEKLEGLWRSKNVK